MAKPTEETAVDAATMPSMKSAIDGALKDVIPPAEPAPQKKEETPAPPVKETKEAPAPKSVEPTDEMILGKKAEAPPPAAVKTDEHEITDTDLAKLPEKTRKAFASMRVQMAEMAEKLTKAAPTATPMEIAKLTEQMTALQRERDEAYDRMGKVDLELDPRFNRKYDNRANAIIKTVTGYLKEIELAEPGEVAKNLARLPIKERLEAMKEQAPDLVAALVPLYAQLDGIREERTTELAQHVKTREVLEQQTQQQIEQVQTAAFKEAQKAALEGGHFLFARVEGNESWNQNVAAIEKAVQDTYKADPITQAKAIALGVVAPVYLKMLQQRTLEVQSLKATLKRLGVSEPPLGGDGGAQQPKGGERGEKMTPASAAAMALAGVTGE